MVRYLLEYAYRVGGGEELRTVIKVDLKKGQWQSTNSVMGNSAMGGVRDRVELGITWSHRHPSLFFSFCFG